MDTRNSRPKPAEDILNRISDELAKGTVPWHKPWVVRPECILSYDRGKPYSLRNRMLLSFAGEYATFHQIKKLGGTINKGAKGRWVYFSKEVKRRTPTFPTTEHRDPSPSQSAVAVRSPRFSELRTLPELVHIAHSLSTVYCL